MSKLLNRDVSFINENTFEEIENLFKTRNKEIFLLENLRFSEGEINNENKFAKEFARPFETFI